MRRGPTAPALGEPAVHPGRCRPKTERCVLNSSAPKSKGWLGKQRLTAMKTLYSTVAILAVCCVSCQHVPQTGREPTSPSQRSEVLHLVPPCEFEGEVFYFDFESSALDSAPKWSAKADFPPLSPRKAEAVALNWAQSVRPDVTKWLLESISLEPRNGLDDDGCWYYVVTFSRGDIAVTGLPYFLRVPVLMSGRVVQALTRHGTR